MPPLLGLMNTKEVSGSQKRNPSPVQGQRGGGGRSEGGRERGREGEREGGRVGGSIEVEK